MRREAREARSFLHGLRRMLVPVRDGRYALMAGEVVAHLAGTRDVEAVALHIQALGNGTPPPLPAPGPQGGESHVAWAQRTVASPEGTAAGILAEAARDYDLLVLGAPDARPESGLFGRVVDAVVRRSPCTTLVLRAAHWRDHGVHVRRILLPTTGTQADLRAAEFALALAQATTAEVVALHVVDTSPLTEPFGGRTATLVGTGMTHGWQATAAIERLGAELAVSVRREVRTRVEGTASAEIVKYAAAGGFDLIVMHAERRAAHDELYCGRTIQQVLHRTHCPLTILLDPA